MFSTWHSFYMHIMMINNSQLVCYVKVFLIQTLQTLQVWSYYSTSYRSILSSLFRMKHNDNISNFYSCNCTLCWSHVLVRIINKNFLINLYFTLKSLFYIVLLYHFYVSINLNYILLLLYFNYLFVKPLCSFISIVNFIL